MDTRNCVFIRTESISETSKRIPLNKKTTKNLRVNTTTEDGHAASSRPHISPTPLNGTYGLIHVSPSLDTAPEIERRVQQVFTH